MSKYDLYGKFTIDDGKSVIDREISLTKEYPEMVNSELVIPPSTTQPVSFGTITICKFVYLKTDKAITLSLADGSNSIDLTVESDFCIVDTKLTEINIHTGSNQTRVMILIAGE